MGRGRRDRAFSWQPPFDFDAGRPWSDAEVFGGVPAWGAPVRWQDTLDYADGQINTRSANAWHTLNGALLVDETLLHWTDGAFGKYANIANSGNYFWAVLGSAVALDLTRGYSLEYDLEQNTSAPLNLPANADSNEGVLLEWGAFDGSTAAGGFRIEHNQTSSGGVTTAHMSAYRRAGFALIAHSGALPQITDGGTHRIRIEVAAATAAAPGGAGLARVATVKVDAVAAWTFTMPAGEADSTRTSPGLYIVSEDDVNKNYIRRMRLSGYAP